MVKFLRNVLVGLGLLTFVLWFFGFTAPEETYAESRVECTESDTTGFHPIKGEYKATTFTERKFSLHIRKGRQDRSRMTLIEKDGNVELACRDMPGGFDGLSCISPTETVNLNLLTNKFTRVGGYGYAFGSDNSVSIAIGTCKAV